jgi:hypothetical protein
VTDDEAEQDQRESPPRPPVGCYPSDVVAVVAQLLIDRGHTPTLDPACRHIAESAAAGLLMALGVRVVLHGREAKPLPYHGLSLFLSGPAS